jgi:hypothetical protein
MNSTEKLSRFHAITAAESDSEESGKLKNIRVSSIRKFLERDLQDTQANTAINWEKGNNSDKELRNSTERKLKT